MRNNFLIIASVWLASFISLGASATEIHPVDGNWYLFDVDELVSQSGGVEWIDAQADASLGYIGDGTALTFSFSLVNSAFLNVVDVGISGDVFTLLINGNHYTSSAVAADSGIFVGLDLESAWASPEFSRLSILLAPGLYTVTGFLHQSAADDAGFPYMATVGGLQIVDADEPGVFFLLGIGALIILRRRARDTATNALSGKGASV